MAGSDDFQAVAVSHASGAVARQKLGERLVVTFYEIVLLMSEKQSEDLVIGLCSEYLNEFLVLLLEIPRVAEIDADHKIEKQSDYRQNGDNQKPGDFFAESPLSNMMTMMVPVISRASKIENMMDMSDIVNVNRRGCTVMLPQRSRP